MEQLIEIVITEYRRPLFSSQFDFMTTLYALRVFEASPLFCKSDMIGKRMKRIERMRTDFDSPLARLFPPQAEKIRFYPFNPFHPFCHPAALVELNQGNAGQLPEAWTVDNL